MARTGRFKPSSKARFGIVSCETDYTTFTTSTIVHDYKADPFLIFNAFLAYLTPFHHV